MRVRLAEALDRDFDWLKQVPVNDMVKLSWIRKLKDKKEQ